MSTIKQVFNNGVSNVNLTAKTDIPVIKAYKDAEAPKEKSGVSFDRQPVALESQLESKSETEVVEVEKTADEQRKARREEWSQASQVKNRAIQAEKEAKEKLAQAKAFEDLAKRSDVDPIELVKALGKDPTEFLRKYQNSMFNIKEEPEPKKEEDVNARLDRFEKAEQERQQKHQELQSNMIRQNYISSKIAPVLRNDTEKFQLLNYNNMEKSAEYIYDLMNSHYAETGEELNPMEVAEAYEEQLAKEFEEKLSAVKKIGKFSKMFREDVVEEAAEPQLGAKTISSSTFSGAPASAQTSTKVAFNDKKARLNKMLKKFGG